MGIHYAHFPITVPFGNPNYDVGLGGSHDMDVGAPPNYPVYAMLPMTISDISAPDWGKQVCGKLDTPWTPPNPSKPGDTVPYMGYLHLSAVNPALQLGQHIGVGELIGWVGGGNVAGDYAGTSNPTGSNFTNSANSSSQIQTGIAFHRGPAYGGVGWETFPPVDWSLDPTPLVNKTRETTVISPAVKHLGRIGMFFGIDTFSWQPTQWDAAAEFCKTHGINFAIVKVFEITQGEWYNGTFASQIAPKFLSRGVQVLPYGFLYGGQGLQWELTMLVKYMQLFGTVAADMEGSWWFDQPAQGKALFDGIANQPGLFFGSIPADPTADTFQPMVSRLLSMPMSYDDALVSTTVTDMAAIGNMPVYPTLDLSNEFGPDNVVANAQWAAQFDQMSLWYYGFATANPALVDQVVKIVGSLPAEGASVNVPFGWTDKVVNGDPQLFNPSTPFIVRGAMRTTVLNWPGGWEPANVPVENEQQEQQLEHSNPSLGAGVRQRFRWRTLEMVFNKGNIIEEAWTGVELLWYEAALAALNTQFSNDQTEISTLNAQIATLQQELAAAQAGDISPALQKAINDAAAAFTSAASSLSSAASAISQESSSATALAAELQPFVH